MKKICLLLVFILSASLLSGCNGGNKMDSEKTVSEKIVSEINKNLLDKWLLSNDIINNECTPAWTFDYEMAKRKGLSDDGKTFNEKYFYIQAAYKYAFCIYLKSNLGLGDYDEQLSTSQLKFIETKEGNKTFYQKNDPSNMKFIFLRNNIYVEKLSEEDIKTIENALLNSNKIDKDILNIVRNTYKDVISSTREVEDYAEAEIIFEATTLFTRKAPNTALVLGVSDSYRWNDEGYLVDTENERMKEEYIRQLTNIISEEFSNKLKMPVVFFIYK